VEPLFNINGLMFWTAKEIRLRRSMADHFTHGLQDSLRAINPAWQFHEIEAPLLTPDRLLNPNYTRSDVWVQEIDNSGLIPDFIAFMRREDSLSLLEPLMRRHAQQNHGGDPAEAYEDLRDEFARARTDLLEGSEVFRPCETVFSLWRAFSNNDTVLALRPETTPGSYVYAQHLLNTHSGARLPLCVWQTGKSFRRESDQVTKNMRLKEFYQQEFQCLYTADTGNDYHAMMQEPVRKLVAETISLPTRVVPSDRLPSYSQVTVDVEVNNGDRWMEICSISRRTDFPQKSRVQTRTGPVEKDVLVLEVAIGLDRCVYNWNAAREDV
jgi:glycyl-tRNA synthetase